jgi:glycosyltransferase involved in cell wall biosynthesis
MRTNAISVLGLWLIECVRMATRKVLVLYRELAGYFMTCMRHLAQEHGVEIDIVAYPVNPSAPFQFQDSPGIKLYKRADFSLEQLMNIASEGNYNLIFCGGWTDADYLSVVRAHRGIPSLVGFDKQWLGTPKDWVSAAKNRLLIKSLFDFAFVPGEEQKNYALRMGFDLKHILQGAYSCDVDLFSAVFEHKVHSEKRKLWFAGRYVADKCIDVLCEAFVELKADGFQNWQLHAIGVGELANKLPVHADIVHHGFQQPSDMQRLMHDGELFVLPSMYEPWGVVVHEFAVSGYALIVSDKVGARTAFVRHGENGSVVQAGNKQDLKKALAFWMSKSPNELHEAGMKSRDLGLKISPQHYAESILHMMLG